MKKKLIFLALTLSLAFGLGFGVLGSPSKSFAATTKIKENTGSWAVTGSSYRMSGTNALYNINGVIWGLGSTSFSAIGSAVDRIYIRVVGEYDGVVKDSNIADTTTSSSVAASARIATDNPSSSFGSYTYHRVYKNGTTLSSGSLITGMGN